MAELRKWASIPVYDEETGVLQVRDLNLEEWSYGWLRNVSISAQQLNSLFNQITSNSNPVTCSPYLHLKSKPIPEEAIEMGSSISQDVYPILFEYYGSTLPDITSEAPTGFTYIVRKQ